MRGPNLGRKRPAGDGRPRYITHEVKGKQYGAIASGHRGGSIPLSGSATV